MNRSEHEEAWRKVARLGKKTVLVRLTCEDALTYAQLASKARRESLARACPDGETPGAADVLNAAAAGPRAMWDQLTAKAQGIAYTDALVKARTLELDGGAS